MKNYIISISMLAMVACYLPDNNPPYYIVPREYDPPPVDVYDGGVEEIVDNSSNPSYYDAGVDSDKPLPVCEPQGGMVVGHCVTNQGTLCIEYTSDHEEECVTSGHLVTGWFDGHCSNMEKSNGGCIDRCGVLSYSYRLGGVVPNDSTRLAARKACVEKGGTYLPPVVLGDE